MAENDPPRLEQLRAASGLAIDEEGRFRHRGEPITHARTLEVLWGSLRREPDGRYAVQVGRERAFVAVEDAPYGVRAVSFDPAGRATLHLTDGTEEPLDPATLRLGAEGVLRCRVKGGAHPARFTRPAQVSLGLALEKDPGASGSWLLRVGDAVHRVGADLAVASPPRSR